MCLQSVFTGGELEFPFSFPSSFTLYSLFKMSKRFPPVCLWEIRAGVYFFPPVSSALIFPCALYRKQNAAVRVWFRPHTDLMTAVWSPVNEIDFRKKRSLIQRPSTKWYQTLNKSCEESPAFLEDTAVSLFVKNKNDHLFVLMTAQSFFVLTIIVMLDSQYRHSRKLQKCKEAL